MPDFGTARCDFPGGSADTLSDSIRRILVLPEGRDSHTWETTVGDQKRWNGHVGAGRTRAAFAADHPVVAGEYAGGAVPRAGRQAPEGNGTSDLKVPVNRL
ncbi:MAG: hypothetical protein WBP18_02735 [Paracoccaceae bacterium]